MCDVAIAIAWHAISACDLHAKSIAVMIDAMGTQQTCQWGASIVVRRLQQRSRAQRRPRVGSRANLTSKVDFELGITRN